MSLLQSLLLISLPITIVVIAEIVTKPVVTRLSNHVLFEEFPKISKSDIAKFSSFDPDLGWERQPNETRKKDTGHQKPDNPDSDKVVYSTDSYGSRVCEVPRKDDEFSITTYGDSYCFCREVNDNETIQHYTSELLNVHVSNYGVGNYGLDQSLFRMKKRFENDPADYIVIIFSDVNSIERTLSLWKHYYEFGNTFAIKPRYKLNKYGLEIVPTPIEKKEDILNISKYKKYLRENDYHYNNWFLQYYQRRPHLTYWFRNIYNAPHMLFSVSHYIAEHTSMLSPISNATGKYKNILYDKKREQFLNNKREYQKRIKKEFNDLFSEIIAEFAMYANSKGATPVLLPVRHYSVYNEGYDPLDKELKDNIRQNNPTLNIIDSREYIWKQVENPQDLYVSQDRLGGHPSPHHNRLIAKQLANFIEKDNN